MRRHAWGVSPCDSEFSFANAFKKAIGFSPANRDWPVGGFAGYKVTKIRLYVKRVDMRTVHFRAILASSP
jgi:hypothetical protein